MLTAQLAPNANAQCHCVVVQGT